ncbi:MAG: kelch repeat-containing protein [Candidatus Sericytochromatia bacterium]|nr:kelch repeat-containing protein [Candidatus Sericytochromatia bacterium]
MIARLSRSNQPFRLGGRLPLLLAGLLLGCQPSAWLGREAGPPGLTTPANAWLRLDWTALQAGRRSLLAFDLQPARYRISLLDAQGQPVREVELAPGPSQAVLADLPLLPRVLVRVVSLDANLAPLPNGVWRGLGPIVGGENRFALTPASTVAGAIVEELRQRDLVASTTLVESLDFSQVTPAVEAWQRHFRVSHPGLLDVSAIAQAWHASGSLPTVQPAFLPTPARLLLQPQDWPPGAEARVALSDPTSLGLTIDGEVRELGPVPPGTWTLQLLPLGADGLASQSHTVHLAPGQRLELPLSFGSVDAAPSLPVPRGEAAFGVVSLPGGSAALVLAGGQVQAPPSATTPAWPAFADDLALVGSPATSALQLPAVNGFHAVSGAAGAVHGDRLYLFGGLGPDFDPVGGVRRLSLASGTAEMLPSLPDGKRAELMAAASLGGALYVTGGRPSWPFPSSGTTHRYDPVANAWATTSLPSFPAAGYGCASAVVQDTWYLFGGRKSVLSGFLNLMEQDLSDVYAYNPSQDSQFRQVSSMPTARYGAAAASVGGRIWVAGGLDGRGRLSGAVEVFDPASGTWERKAPLRTPRAFAGMGLVDGRLLVAGGLLGRSEEGALPVRTVEAIGP